MAEESQRTKEEPAHGQGFYEGWTPVPDPTVLTTQQLYRAIQSSRDIIETRLSGMDKAIELLQKSTDKVPQMVKDSVSQLQDLHDEKFTSTQSALSAVKEGIERQFAERDTRTEQTSKDSKVAVDAALQAAKEAVAEQNKSNSLAMSKSENAFTKQIDQIGLLITTTAKGTDDKIDDIKTRLNSLESRTNAEAGRAKGMGEGWGYIAGFIGLLLAAGTFIMLLMNHNTGH